MMTCCIIDDEPHAIAVLRRYIDRTEGLSLVFSDTDAVSALRFLAARQPPPDIIFCDIAMPDISGMEVGRLVPNECQLVYTTAYQEYAIEAYKRNAVDYLTKPIFYEDFEESICRCRKRKALKIEVVPPETSRPPSLLIHTSTVKGDYTNVIFDTLIYIRASANYLYFYSDGTNVPQVCYMSFRKLEAALDPKRFIRVHRSFIVNISYIAEIRLGKLYLTGTGQTITLSLAYRKKLRELLGDRFL